MSKNIRYALARSIINSKFSLSSDFSKVHSVGCSSCGLKCFRNEVCVFYLYIVFGAGSKSSQFRSPGFEET